MISERVTFQYPREVFNTHKKKLNTRLAVKKTVLIWLLVSIVVEVGFSIVIMKLSVLA